MRLCPNCKTHHFPRVDPVVIMLAVRGDRCLLGRGHRRPGARFSCLAGFMEPGETPEEAVRRECAEELGATIGPLDLFCVCSRFRDGKSDHITVFVCRSFTLGKKCDLEIEDCQLFPLAALPPDASAGTRRRVRELMDGDGCGARLW